MMAELGNSIVNRIFERNTGDRVKPDSTATREQRKVWIEAKYKEKAFVDKDVFKAKEVLENEAWTVNRLRRRARIEKKKSAKTSEKEDLDEEEKDVDTSLAEEPSLLESVLRASTLSTRTDGSTTTQADQGPGKPRVLNTETVLFGGTLEKHHVASVELDSDQVRSR